MKRVQYIGLKPRITCTVPFGAKSKGEVKSYVVFKPQEILELEDEYADRLVSHSPFYRFADEGVATEESAKKAVKVVKKGKKLSERDVFSTPAEVLLEAKL